MAIRLKSEHVESIRRHAEASYPYECCGFLVGRASGAVKTIGATWAAENAHRGEERRRRYLLEPRAVLEAGRRADREGVEILGVYHSHPDHRGRPSHFDLEQAWPFYSYVIVEVRAGEAERPLSWVLCQDRSAFEPEAIEVEADR